MMYSSLKFILFALIVVFLYYILPNKYKSTLLILANCYFCYTLGKYHFLFLVCSIFLSYGIACCIRKTKAKYFFIFGIIAIVFSLFVIKFGKGFGFTSIIIPIGYSYYALQMISFLSDIYHEKIKEFNFIDYFQYMSFFPILLQGPICRYNVMTQEFHKDKKYDFNQVVAGTYIIFFGLFKKLVIADRLAIFVNNVFNNYTEKTGGVVLIALIFYAIQLYTDFSGCTDISRGVSKTLDIDIPNNFNNPYFSLSIKEFWSRWHISLSGWLKEYIYIPLGGNRKGTKRKYFNLMVTFLVSGFWHGVGIQYLIWGFIQAVGQIVEGKLLIKLNQFFRGIYVIVFTLGSWLIFRAHGMKAAIVMGLNILMNGFNFDGIYLCGLDSKEIILALIAIVIIFIIDALKEKNKHLLKDIQRLPWLLQEVFLLVLIYSVIIFGVYGSGYSAAEFIYMQF